MVTIHTLASLVGYVGALLLFLQVVFGTRHVFSFFSHDTVRFNKIHKIIGIYGTVLVFFHPLLQMMWQENTLRWIFVPSFVNETEMHISFGRFALLFLFIVWVTSAIVRESIKWRPWKYIHLLSFPIVLLVFIHVIDIGSFFEDYPWVRVIWFVFFGIFIVSILYRLLAWAGVTKRVSSVVASHLHNDSILILTITLPEGVTSPEIGQHMYIQKKRFGSEHPFTVMDWNEGKREMTFGMRSAGPFVQSLVGIQKGEKLLIDGPYGVFTKEARNEEEKVVIAGGVGITPFVRLAREYGKGMTLLYTNRSKEDALFNDSLKKWCDRYVDVIDGEGDPGEGVVYGRLDKAKIRALFGEKAPLLPYFICGSPLFISAMKEMLQDCGVPSRQIYYEELGF